MLQHFEYEKLEEMSGVLHIHLVKKNPLRTLRKPLLPIAIGIAVKILTARKSLTAKSAKNTQRAQ